jgi:hypothetical protein
MEKTRTKQREKQESSPETMKRVGRPPLPKEQARVDWSGSFSPVFLARVREYAEKELRSVSSAIEILATRQLDETAP